MLLEELDLLGDEQLKGISKFHPILKEFNGQRLGGGVFLSPRTFTQYKHLVLFYDESQELRKSLAPMEIERKIEINTKLQDIFKLQNEVLKTLTPYLVGCDTKIKKLAKQTYEIEKLIATNKQLPYLYFLGELSTHKKLPELIINNDLFVYQLKMKNVIGSYPSDLLYVTWSQKILDGLGDFIFWGVTDKISCNEPQIDQISKQKRNICFRGALIPGIRQIYLYQFLLQSFNS